MRLAAQTKDLMRNVPMHMPRYVARAADQKGALASRGSMLGKG